MEVNFSKIFWPNDLSKRIIMMAFILLKKEVRI